MFWNRKATCPIDQKDEELVYKSFLYLIGIFGLDVLREKEVVLPTKDFFNWQFSGENSDVFFVYRRICHYMDIDAKAITLKFFDEKLESPKIHNEEPGYFSSHYVQNDDGSVEIFVERGQLRNPSELIATLAYELANYKLLGEQRLTKIDEFLTEMTAVIFGFGIFTANASVIKMESSSDLLGSDWMIKGGAGFLHYSLHGFALALFAHYRGEAKPNWINFLENDVYRIFKKSYNYIDKNSEKFKI